MTRRWRTRSASAVLGGALLAATLVSAPAQAAGTTSAATVCGLGLGSVTAGGDHKVQVIKATTPLTASTPVVRPTNLYPDGAARLPSSLGFEPVVPAGEQRGGFVVLGDRMYETGYTLDGSGGTVPGSVAQRLIGGGWAPNHRYFDRSVYYGTTAVRQNTYALLDFALTRWTVTPTTGWRNRKAYNGFASVKTMALISQTATYDTFLANTYGGALYTIRVYTSGSAAPVVKKVRSSTWQNFDSLVAVKCGSQSTLLLGIDKETKAGYLYAVGHANGTATLIRGLGKVPATFGDPHYFRFFADTPESGHLFGE
ncbi:hypothetical protein [Kribbella sp. NPDC023855]|uniref:hypothetical protein n=1 Tax=Kribbella sp. NPDC023855 TaxID=3154698 RepID=UPI0033DCCAB2